VRRVMKFTLVLLNRSPVPRCPKVLRRDELLNAWQLDSLLEARVHIGDWRIDYNCNWPHTAHGDLTPAEFVSTWKTTA
jgi:hypothetical protein